VEARSALRALSDRYSTDYPPVQEILTQIESIEQNAIPRVVRGIIEELQSQEMQTSSRVSNVSAELEAIPPRTIEEGRLSRSVSITESLYNDLRNRVEQARLAAASAIPEIRILDRAQVPQTPLQDERMQLALMIFLGCLGAAAGGAILLDRTDAKFRYATDVSRDIGLGILGSIPRIQAKGGKQGVLNAAQALEAFRELRIHVGFAYGSAGPITLAVSSPAAGEGKSLISSNLAVAFAEVGQRTLLIDGDTRRGDAHRLFGLEQSPGLIDYLKERAGEEDVIQKTGHDNLDFIGCGARGISTPELLASPQMVRFMGKVKQAYDVIIVDCPPLASGGDPVILSTLTGNLAVVIRTGATEKQLTHAKLDQLAGLPIRILGAILNDVDPSDGYHYYYASYLAGYEPVPSEEDEEGVQLVSDGSGTRG
jgi:capsular exopolysaccharide synthesis family protein